MLRILFLGLLFGLFTMFACAQIGTLSVSEKPSAFSFFTPSSVSSIYTDTADAKVVTIAATAFAKDVQLISGKEMQVLHTIPSKGFTIVAGTIGQSKMIDALIQSKKMDVTTIRNKWECFIIKTVGNHLVIAGSDRRGTAFGIFHLSRLMGVSPWVYWADVLPAKRKQLYVTGSYISKEPSVKYRGIFINDEDWGLFPWAKRNIDTDVQNIGPKTYAKVFELLLRLKANYIWPAMHDSTKAFYYYKQSPKVADDYAIAIGGSHCEPMLRNNVCEWEQTFEEEYKKKPGEWRYDVNKEEIFKYWDDRIKEAVNYESVVTIGMRGVHDGSMPGPKDPGEKVKLLENVITDQRGILENNFGQPAEKLPQIFVPYKEVLSLYRRGMKLPDDITIIWPDENFGYIRQLSTPEEQKRSGGSGIYYHLSYLGGPHDHTWLSSTSPSLISYEMTKAFQFGADRLWVVNVGDIKPAEMETQFFLELAYDINGWTPGKAQQYSLHWATQTFGVTSAAAIADIKNEYYRLAQEGKPEFMRMLNYLPAAREERLAAYSRLYEKTDEVKKQIPAHLQNAFFELIEYPVKGSDLINQKIFYAQMSYEFPVKAKEYSQKSKAAFDKINELTLHYNTGIENGKWNGMMDYKPRNLAVFGMPHVAAPEVLEDGVNETVVYDRRYLDRTVDSFGVQTGEPSILSLPAAAYKTKKEIAGEKLIAVPGLGAGGKSISRYPFTGVSFQKEAWAKAPYVEYAFSLKPGSYQLVLKCLPTHAIHKGRNLGMAVIVNGGKVQLLDIDNPQEDKRWKTDILRGYTEASLPVEITKEGKTVVRVYLLDTGLALSKVDIRE
ncbi:MAG TPA: glycosyl hydrolase 115 family protein [Chitinophagaceae bacterium]|nr:glycosyl hydrolase 115 family protein [Chitinophagaceae bacterium]